MIPLESLATGTPGGAVAFLLARVLFGAVLAFMGVNHFLNTEQMTGYAQHKGLPAPGAMVLLSGAVLLFGGLGIVLGVAPSLASLGVAAFMLISAVTMHDFWAVPEEQQQQEMTNFLKNVTLFGAALGFYAVSGLSWPYALNVVVL